MFEGYGVGLTVTPLGASAELVGPPGVHVRPSRLTEVLADLILRPVGHLPDGVTRSTRPPGLRDRIEQRALPAPPPPPPEPDDPPPF